ncbi:RNA polymerase sigma factor [Solitalea koreensis]|uniref:RNA polymerase sigma-70 factor, ECF subfamily n=1 Tax=Solitalea koreensis TaxID=543615 RepID=A0A521DK04_9SPHI|nr:sigma-70 family RNA polymerase sigma factor [Solitalea koreensis]SMO72063.1 RNA polymerase sigma-70 factor, ECF subfamily [Solitalea koreensis]
MSVEVEYSIYWESFRNGDKQALFDLYNSLYFQLVRYGLKLSADDELVKDSINQVFLELWEKRERLTPVGNVKSYLFTCLRRNMLDQYSYMSKTKSVINIIAVEEEQREMSYEEILINVQQDESLKRRLHEAIQQLTPRQMELIKMKFFDGLSYEQIALSTSQNIKTSYNIIYDAICFLRKTLKKG